MGSCFSRNIDGYDRRTGMPPGGGAQYYGNDGPQNGDNGGRVYARRRMHPMGARPRRYNRRRATIAVIAATC